MKRKTLRILINIAIAVMVIAAWLSMFFRAGGLLASLGVKSLRYFTVLSNLLEAAVSIVLVVALLRGKDSERVSLLKLIGASAVSLTFLVVMIFLGPLFGYPMMFRGANLWFHLIVPLAAIAEYVFFNEIEVAKPKIRWVMTSTLVYGTVYLTNILLNGAAGNDFYGFTTWGLPAGFVIFAITLLLTFLSGRLMVKENAKFLAKSTVSSNKNR